MVWIVGYLGVVLGMLGWGTYLDLAQRLPPWLVPGQDVYRCALAGGYGGLLYLIRAVYLNRAVRDQWDDRWRVWYYLRPVASVLSGGVSYLFLTAGLLVLGAATPQGGGTLTGFLALAFIAGLNVDRFIEKIEDIAQATWGIKKSRTASRDETDGKGV